MALRAKVLEYAASVDRLGSISAHGHEPVALGPGIEPEHLVLAALVRCSIASLRYHARRLGADILGEGRAHGVVTKRASDLRYAFVEIHARWALGEMEAGIDLFDPEIVFEAFMPDASGRIVSRGVSQIEAFMREFLAQWSEYRMVGDQFQEVSGDKVLVEARQAGTGRQSGVEVEGPTFSVWTFQDGKVVHLVFETDRRRALEAAGVKE